MAEYRDTFATDEDLKLFKVDRVVRCAELPTERSRDSERANMPMPQ